MGKFLYEVDLVDEVKCLLIICNILVLFDVCVVIEFFEIVLVILKFVNDVKVDE